MGQGDAVMIQFDGGIGDFPVLIQTVEGLIADGTRRIAIDLANLPFINSAALGYLVMAHKKLLDKGGKLALCHLQPALKHLLAMTALDQVLLVASTEEDAVKALGGSPLARRGWRK